MRVAASMANALPAFQINKIKKTVPNKHDLAPRLRHRSRCSESDSTTGKDESAGDPLSQTALFPDPIKTSADDPGVKSSEHGRSESHSNVDPRGKAKERTADRPYKSVFHLLCSELTRGYYLEGDESHYEERRERVYTFMATPRELEKFCVFGFLQCLDAFLFIVTFLPMRIIIALLRLVTYPCTIICGTQTKAGRYPRLLQPAQVCDLLKGIMVVLGCMVVNHIDTSMIYHLVRGQTVIKLYVFYNMLDLVDRVMSGFGQDVLDTLYWTATEPAGNRDKEGRRHSGVLFHFTIAMIYIIVHSFLIMCQVTVLNVAFNSHSKALLTIIMSNNFVEIKGSLFRHVDRNNLQQISCSDVKERFHYTTLLLVVFIVNMAEFNWNPDQVWVILPDITMVLVVELFVDWTKHAFITKFNQISPKTYRIFLVNLAQDMLTSRQKHAFTDYSDQVCRRLGFTPLPLLCLLVRTYSKSIPMVGYLSYGLLALFFCCLVSLKLLTSVILLGVGCRLLEQEQELGRQTDPCEIDSQVIAKKAKSPDSASERNTAQKDSPAKLPHTSPAGNGSPVQTVSADSVLASQRAVGDDFDFDTSWVVRSASDTVVNQQCQLVVGKVEELLHGGRKNSPSPSGCWEEESNDSDAEFHNSLDSSEAGPSAPYVPSAQVSDFDEEKKYK